MRKAESPLGQWALRCIAILIAIAQGLFLLLYAMVPRERSAHQTPAMLLALEFAGTSLAISVTPTFFVWLSLSNELESEKMRRILIATGLAAPVVAYFILAVAL